MTATKPQHTDNRQRHQHKGSSSRWRWNASGTGSRHDGSKASTPTTGNATGSHPAMLGQRHRLTMPTGSGPSSRHDGEGPAGRQPAAPPAQGQWLTLGVARIRRRLAPGHARATPPAQGQWLTLGVARIRRRLAPGHARATPPAQGQWLTLGVARIRQRLTMALARIRRRLTPGRQQGQQRHQVKGNSSRWRRAAAPAHAMTVKGQQGDNRQRHRLKGSGSRPVAKGVAGKPQALNSSQVRKRPARKVDP